MEAEYLIPVIDQLQQAPAEVNQVIVDRNMLERLPYMPRDIREELIVERVNQFIRAHNSVDAIDLVIASLPLDLQYAVTSNMQEQRQDGTDLLHVLGTNAEEMDNVIEMISNHNRVTRLEDRTSDPRDQGNKRRRQNSSETGSPMYEHEQVLETYNQEVQQMLDRRHKARLQEQRERRENERQQAIQAHVRLHGSSAAGSELAKRAVTHRRDATSTRSNDTSHAMSSSSTPSSTHSKDKARRKHSSQQEE